MKWLKSFWRDIVDYLRWQIEHDPFIEELEDEYDQTEKLCELGEKYERLEHHYPNILARLNEAVERKEKK